MGATLKHPNLAFVCQQTGPTVGPTAHPQGSTANRRRSRVNCAGRGFRAHKRKGRNHCSAIGRLVTSCSTRPPPARSSVGGAKPTTKPTTHIDISERKNHSRYLCVEIMVEFVWRELDVRTLRRELAKFASHLPPSNRRQRLI